jgi:hypothetical protein
LASGLVLEVGRSTIPNAGLGLFIRKQSKTTSGILQSIGSAFAGYSRGYVRTNLLGCSDYQTSRAFQFRLEEGLQSTVWFGSKLLTIEEALNQSGATSVAGHHLFFNDDHDGFEADESGKSMASSGGGGNPSKTKVWRKTVGIVPDDDECFFFVPDDISMINGVGGEDSSAIVSPNTASIQTIGHFVNDLAGGDRAKSSEEYDAISSLRNILVLVPRVHAINGCKKKKEDDNSQLWSNVNEIRLEMAGMPLLTLSKTIIVDNDEPMEVGLKYGFQYWDEDSRKE